MTLREFIKLQAPTNRDFLNLKSGRDTFSGLKGQNLRSQVSLQDIQRIDALLQGDKLQEKAMRWCLRELDSSQAIHKTIVEDSIAPHLVKPYERVRK